jgi:hypothetical protein
MSPVRVSGQLFGDVSGPPDRRGRICWGAIPGAVAANRGGPGGVIVAREVSPFGSGRRSRQSGSPRVSLVPLAADPRQLLRASPDQRLARPPLTDNASAGGAVS